MTLGTLRASLLGNLLSGKGLYRAGKGLYRSYGGKKYSGDNSYYSGDNKCDCEKKKLNYWGEGMYRAGKGMYRTGKRILKNVLLPPHLLTNFEIQNYYKNEPRFRGNLPKIKDGAYLINLDEYTDIGTHWIALYVRNNEIIYFDGFGVEYISKDIKKIHWTKKHQNKHI